MSSFQTYPPISFLSLLGVCRKYLFFSMSSSIFVISDDDEWWCYYKWWPFLVVNSGPALRQFGWYHPVGSCVWLQHSFSGKHLVTNVAEYLIKISLQRLVQQLSFVGGPPTHRPKIRQPWRYLVMFTLDKWGYHPQERPLREQALQWSSCTPHKENVELVYTPLKYAHLSHYHNLRIEVWGFSCILTKFWAFPSYLTIESWKGVVELLFCDHPWWWPFFQNRNSQTLWENINTGLNTFWANVFSSGDKSEILEG